MTSARPDTRLLVTSPITTDRSQYATDLTAESAAAIEPDSTRTALDGSGAGRAVECKVDLATGNSGAIVANGPHLGLGGATYAIHVSSDSVRFFAALSDIASLAPPNLSGTPRTYVIGWSTEPNPAGSGGSGARSECFVYDVASGEMARAVVAHFILLNPISQHLGIGGTWDGSALDNVFTGTIHAVRISARFHSRVETREHFVAQTAAPVVEGITAVESPVVPSQVCEAGALVGPAYQAANAALAVGRLRHRLLSPVVQLVTRTPPVLALVNGLASDIDSHRVLALGDGFATHLGWLWRRWTPPHAEWLRTVVQWATWGVGGNDDIDVSLRVYASAQPPHLASEWTSQTLRRTADDGEDGEGVLEAFDRLKVRRGADGYTWLWLGVRRDGSSSEVVVRGCTITPMSAPSIGAEPPNQWGP